MSKDSRIHKPLGIPRFTHAGTCREQLIEVIACGRPGTEMPHFDKYAYEDADCYGLKGKDLGSEAPRYPHSTPLTRREIEAVVDYIIMAFVGK